MFGLLNCNQLGSSGRLKWRGHQWDLTMGLIGGLNRLMQGELLGQSRAHRKCLPMLLTVIIITNTCFPHVAPQE